MKKEDLIKEMQQLSGHSFFLTRKQFCIFMGVSINTAKAYLAGIRPVNNRFYHIPDIADLIMDMSSAASDGGAADGR